MDDDAISRIEAALEAGPTPGPWVAVYPRSCWHVKTCDGTFILDGAYSNAEVRKKVDARYIAACSPDVIRTLLDRLKAAEAENERLREFERSAVLTLPGVYYMDPPDGGDASLLKQLQRMSIDAARYRLLRRKFAIISDGNGNAEFCPINLPRPTYIAPNTAIELDTALDRERLGMDAAANDKTKEDTDAR